MAKNNSILKGIEIKTGTVSASKDIGASSNYIGKYVGNADSSDTNYISGNIEITNGVEDITDTVYYIVNGMSDAESEYWSKNNLAEPTLKWEVKVSNN